MIELYTGLIGSGKTYSTVCRMIEYIGTGGCVVTNIKINEKALAEKLKRDYAWVFQSGQLIYLQEGDKEMARFHEQVPEGSKDKKVLVCIDEASEWLDAYNYSKADSDLMTFLRQSRKVYVDVIFIVQDQTLVNKRVRTLCQWVWWHIDVRTWRLPVIKLAVPLPMIMQMQFDKFQNMVQRKWDWIDKDIFEIYDSFQVYRSIGLKQGVQTKFNAIKGVETMTKGWKFAVIMAYLCCGFLFLMYRKQMKIQTASLSDGRPAKSANPFKNIEKEKSYVPELEKSNVQSQPELKVEKQNWKSSSISNYWCMEIEENGKRSVKRGVWADGREYKEGLNYVYGKCIAINESTIAFADILNKKIFYLRDYGEIDNTLKKPEYASYGQK